MESLKDQPTDAYESTMEDDLGRLIRQSLKDSVAGAEPSARVWPQILARVREMNAPQRPVRKRRPSWSPLVSLVQAVAISALLLAFGLGVDHNWIASSRNSLVRPTPTIQKASPAVEQHTDDMDMLRGYMLVQKQAKPLSLREQRLK